ncbi:MAG: sodium ion-translocating decarboxylase subunit beta [Oscillibacter ruminantium]|uniref:sodium ion-translocating decarboxylase subunit beta n=1 Tax=Oscillibacter ruminantium TaxID=1263547 RepID=UPI002B21BEF9|nr:sodium ion-translocating decarboxylase subunit beta [Oscillibacter ruminantium]MEA5041462.1 sodium ion-translocating decarboxylase subunit beta [Oscillibacter ruminantium]
MALITGVVSGLASTSGFATMDWRQLIMLAVSCVLLYLGIVKKFEPLLLVGIAFGMLLTNLPGGGVFHPEFWGVDVSYGTVLHDGGLLDLLYIGVKTGLYPSLIFMGVGAMTDFSPLIARPSSLFMGAAAQGGIFVALLMATAMGFAPNVAASIAIIGGADGPTAIWLTKILAPEYLGPIAIAAYSYMALIPLIQPPIMKLLTTEKERKIKMETLRPVSKTEKIVFPIMVTIVTCLVLPSVAPLLGCLMLGNLFKECGVTERLSDTVQNALMNIVTIFLGISVGATAVYDRFLSWDTIKIIVLGLIAFCFATACGVLFGKLMCICSGGKINPLIGSAGVSAVPMAARVSQVVGQKYNPANFLLMHAMGPNVAGVIGSAVAAGCLLKLFG